MVTPSGDQCAPSRSPLLQSGSSTISANRAASPSTASAVSLLYSENSGQARSCSVPNSSSRTNRRSLTGARYITIPRASGLVPELYSRRRIPRNCAREGHFRDRRETRRTAAQLLAPASREHLPQLGGGDSLPAQELRQQSDAESRHRRAMQYRRIVDRKLGPHAHFGARRSLGHLEAVFSSFTRGREQRVIAQHFRTIRAGCFCGRLAWRRAPARRVIGHRASGLRSAAPSPHPIRHPGRRSSTTSSAMSKSCRGSAAPAAVVRGSAMTRSGPREGREGLRELAYLLDLDANGARAPTRLAAAVRKIRHEGCTPMDFRDPRWRD